MKTASLGLLVVILVRAYAGGFVMFFTTKAFRRLNALVVKNSREEE
jgi:uncharacterized membrane-anchored protein